MMIGRIVDFLEELERISFEHEELTDTDVRESLHLALNYYFVWGRERAHLPVSFGMFSRQGDALVADAFRRFLETVDESGELSSVPCGQARLDILQAGGAKTASGRLYDEFIGYRDEPLPLEPLPRYLFLEGEYEDGAE